VRALAVAILVGALLVVPGSRASGGTPHCGPFFLVRLPSLGTLTWRTVTRDRTDWHALAYRPTPPIATTEVNLRAGGRVVSRRRVDEQAVRFPLRRDRIQVVTLTQMTEPGTLKASVTVDFKPGVTYTYCAPYAPPGLKIVLDPRR